MAVRGCTLGEPDEQCNCRVASTGWSAAVAPDDEHLHLDELGASKFVIAPAAQKLLVKLQQRLLDSPYEAFGRVEGSWQQYNIVFPSTFGSDRRKPVSARLMAYAEAVYCPIMYVLLFGIQGWQAIRKHLLSFKANTIKVDFHPELFETPEGAGDAGGSANIFHMHLDGRIGITQARGSPVR